jgi:ARG and Rhodanese-Phosphatase-superfamily-associated Protein domain
MKKVGDLLGPVTLGQEAHHQNMAVYQVFVEAGSEFGYLSLDEALEKRLVEVTEMSEAGEVPHLRVVNHGPTPILILAGEELVGAKQNRVVNATFLVRGSVSLAIPVSCVEQGRWSYRSREFGSQKRMSPSRLRSRMEEDVRCSVAESRGFQASQGRVWQSIAVQQKRMGVRSETGAMADIYESYKDKLEGYLGRFTMGDNQRGVVVAINGRVAGLEIFDSADNLAKYYGKLIQSYALDALDAHLHGKNARKTDQAQIQGWVGTVSESPVSLTPSLGLGDDLRIPGDKLVGSGLLYEESVLYLSVFPRANGTETGGSGLARSTRRRMFNA